MSTAYHTAQSQQPVADPRLQGQDVPVVIHPSPGGTVEGTQPRAGVETQTYVTDKKGEPNLWLHDHRAGTAFVVFLASLVLFVQAGKDCTPRSGCTTYYAWGLSVAVLSTFFSLVLFFLLTLAYHRDRTTEESARNDQNYPAIQSPILHRLLATLLFALWIPGAGILTFYAPYVFPGNAYYACWLGFISSAYLFFQVWHYYVPLNTLTYDAPRIVLWLLLLASIIELVQASLDCPARNGGCPTKELKWALAVGIISTLLTFISLIIAIVRKFLPNILLKIMALLLFAMWIPGAGVLTYGGGPFSFLGNAYYACWAAFLTSGYLFYLAFFSRYETADINRNQLAPK